MTWFWLAALGCVALLLFAGYERWTHAVGEELDRAFGGPLTDDADEWMAPLRGSHGRHAQMDITERRIRLAHRVLDRISRGRWLP